METRSRCVGWYGSRSIESSTRHLRWLRSTSASFTTYCRGGGTPAITDRVNNERQQ